MSKVKRILSYVIIFPSLEISIYENGALCYTGTGEVIDTMPDHTGQGAIFNIQKFSLHDGPGIRTTVFMKGCPLRCLWCSNPESQNPHPQRMGDAPDSQWYPVGEVYDICMQDTPFYEESGGGVTLSGGEPLVQWRFTAALLGRLKQSGVHTALETTGCVPPDLFEKATAGADLLLFDVKHHDAARHKIGTGIDNGGILQNLKGSIAAGQAVLPRIPVIPAYNDSIEDARAFAALLRDAGARTAQLLPFHQFGDQKYEILGMQYGMKGEPPLHADELARYQDAFLQEGIAAFF